MSHQHNHHGSIEHETDSEYCTDFWRVTLPDDQVVLVLDSYVNSRATAERILAEFGGAES